MDKRPELSLGTTNSDNLDKSAERLFINHFRSLDQDLKTIKIFDRNEYYSVHGKDALIVANQVYKTTTVLKYLGTDQQLETCTITKQIGNAFIRDLLTCQSMRVELFEQVAGRWTMTKTASPGNLAGLEDVIYSGESNDFSVKTTSVVMALRVTQKDLQNVVGIAFTDATSHKTLYIRCGYC